MPSQWPIGWHVRRGAKVGAIIGGILAGLVLLAYYGNLAAGVDRAGAGMGAGILVWLASLPFGLALIFAVGAVGSTLPLPASLESSEGVMWAIVCTCIVCNWMTWGAGFGLLRGWLTREIAPPAT
jgi:hypothetical protein